MSRTPSPTSIPPNLNESLEDEVFFGQPDTDEEMKARLLCEEFEQCMKLEIEQAAATATAGEEEENEEVTTPILQTPIKRDISLDDTIDEVTQEDTAAAVLSTSENSQMEDEASEVNDSNMNEGIVLQTPIKICPNSNLLSPLAFPEAPDLTTELMNMAPRSQQQSSSDELVVSPIKMEDEIQEPEDNSPTMTNSSEEVTEEPAPAPASVEAPVDPETEAATTILSQVRATILRLKQNRTNSRLPKLNSLSSSVATSSTLSTPASLIPTNSLPTTIVPTSTVSRMSLAPNKAPVTLGNSNGPVTSVPSAVAVNPTTLTAPAVVPPVTSGAAITPSVATCPQPSQPLPSKSELRSNTPAANPSMLAAKLALSSSTFTPAALGPSVTIENSCGSSKLSTLASSKQLASPAPMKKSMSVFNSTRTATIQAQVAALQKNTLQQQQQLLNLNATLTAKGTTGVNGSILRTGSTPAGPAPSTTTASSILLSRPLSAPVLPSSTSSFGDVKRGVLWRDEDAGSELEEIRFLSPPVTPEKEGDSGVSPVKSNSFLSLTRTYAQFIARNKLMPDLTKTPTKSCLRRTKSATNLNIENEIGVSSTTSGTANFLPTSCLLPSNALPPSSTINLNRLPPSTNVTNSSTLSSLASSLSSGARRVQPNLTRSTVATTGATRTTMQPLPLQPSVTNWNNNANSNATLTMINGTPFVVVDKSGTNSNMIGLQKKMTTMNTYPMATPTKNTTATNRI